MPAQQVSYNVRGATFTLQLPDGRSVVVNCESKFQERMAGPAGNHRSCRIPLVDEIEAAFQCGKCNTLPEWDLVVVLQDDEAALHGCTLRSKRTRVGTV
jgi:hypothetical protein